MVVLIPLMETSFDWVKHSYFFYMISLIKNYSLNKYHVCIGRTEKSELKTQFLFKTLQMRQRFQIVDTRETVHK